MTKSNGSLVPHLKKHFELSKNFTINSVWKQILKFLLSFLKKMKKNFRKKTFGFVRLNMLTRKNNGIYGT